MISWCISEVDRATGYGASCSVEAGPGMRGLEHVPVWKDIEVLSEQAVVGVAEDVPGVRGVDLGEEVITVSIVSYHTWQHNGTSQYERTCYGPVGAACCEVVGCGTRFQEIETCN